MYAAVFCSADSSVSLIPGIYICFHPRIILGKDYLNSNVFFSIKSPIRTAFFWGDGYKNALQRRKRNRADGSGAACPALILGVSRTVKTRQNCLTQHLISSRLFSDNGTLFWDESGKARMFPHGFYPAMLPASIARLELTRTSHSWSYQTSTICVI